jgi:hypothetical protein
VAVDCVLSLATFLSLRADHYRPQTEEESIFGVPAQRQDYAKSDRLLWGLVEQYKIDSRVTPTVKGHIVDGLQGLRDNQDIQATRISAVAELAVLFLLKPP